MNKLTLATLLTLSCLAVTAQVDYTNDSLRIVNAEWSIDTLEGFYLKRYHFGVGTLFCSAQHLSIIEIPAKSHRRLAFVCDSTTATVSDMAQRERALAAVNGTFFDMGRGNPVCYLRIDGNRVGENTPQKDDSVNRKYYQYAVITLGEEPAPHLWVPDSIRTWEDSLSGSNVMTAGPMLVHDGQEVPQRDDRTFVTHRHNRTALGIRSDSTILILVADGRHKDKAEGLSLPELTRIMLWLGCTDAINLDGGSSTTMYVHDKPHNGVVNYPSGNGRYDHEGQQPVSNAILVL